MHHRHRQRDIKKGHERKRPILNLAITWEIHLGNQKIHQSQYKRYEYSYAFTCHSYGVVEYAEVEINRSNGSDKPVYAQVKATIDKGAKLPCQQTGQQTKQYQVIYWAEYDAKNNHTYI